MADADATRASMKRVLACLLLCSALLPLARCASQHASDVQVTPPAPRLAASDEQVLALADIHLDPFDRHEIVDQLAQAPVERWASIFHQGMHAAHLSSYGHDANGALFLSGIDEMRRSVPHPRFLLLAGDLLAHNFYQRFVWAASKNDAVSYRRFVDKTVRFIFYELTQAYPHTQIFPTIGNNDGYCGDYASTPHDAYLARQALLWAPLVDPQHRFADIPTTIARGGYYRASTASGLRIISLNSVYLSQNYQNRCGIASEQPAQSELAWLRSLWASTPAAPTIVLTHIPVGIDGFKTFFQPGFPVSLWRPEYQAAFLPQVNTPAHHVTALFTGHLHDLGYRQSDAGGGENRPLVVLPSLSPIFGNSPAFSEVWFSRQGAIDDLRVHRFEAPLHGAPRWQTTLDFRQRYHLPALTARSIAALQRTAARNADLRLQLQRDSVGNAPALALTTLDWRASWCTSVALTAQTYLRCLRAVRSSGKPVPSQR